MREQIPPRLRRIALAALLTVAGILLVARPRPIFCPIEVNSSASRPNVVMVVTDDLDVGLASALPRWSAVASTGVQYTNAFVTAPLCCPSRVSILTGLYPHNHGVVTNTGVEGGYAKLSQSGVESCTLPIWLEQAGYRTAMIGKYVNGYGWNASGREGGPQDYPPGWDEWIGLWQRWSYESYALNVNGNLVQPDAYQTVELTDRAVEFIQQSPAPFFLYLAPLAVHTRLQPEPRYADEAVPPGQDPQRYRVMLSVEDMLDRLVEVLPANTYLIALSDNGYHLAPQRGKSLPYDSDTRVPLFILGPGIEPHVDDRVVLNIDLAPTIAQLAGVLPPTLDGRPIPLHGEAGTSRDAFVIELPEFRAIRTSQALYVEWSDGRTELIGSGDRAALANQLHALEACRGPTC